MTSLTNINPEQQRLIISLDTVLRIFTTMNSTGLIHKCFNILSRFPILCIVRASTYSGTCYNGHSI